MKLGIRKHLFRAAFCTIDPVRIDWRCRRWRGIEILGKCEIGFVYLFVKMLLNVLRCIDFTMILSESLMWHVFISWYKLDGLHPYLLNLISWKNLGKLQIPLIFQFLLFVFGSTSLFFFFLITLSIKAWLYLS